VWNRVNDCKEKYVLDLNMNLKLIKSSESRNLRVKVFSNELDVKNARVYKELKKKVEIKNESLIVSLSLKGNCKRLETRILMQPCGSCLSEG
jgi:hypothetical protein